MHLTASPGRPAPGGPDAGRARRTASRIHVFEPADGVTEDPPSSPEAHGPEPSPYA